MSDCHETCSKRRCEGSPPAPVALHVNCVRKRCDGIRWWRWDGAVRIVLFALVAMAGTATPATAQDTQHALFDGKTLEGWEGNREVFRVEDGAIVGGSMSAAIPRNEFLCTQQEYSDFDLELKFKLTGTGVNSGVQFRTRRIPGNHEVEGYQADLGDGYWGALYDESRRNKVLVAPEASVVDKALRRNEWNDYRIRCQGKRIQLWINGIPTIDYVEPEEGLPARGVIGLQIHAGPPSEARFKDLRLRELPPSDGDSP